MTLRLRTLCLVMSTAASGCAIYGSDLLEGEPDSGRRDTGVDATMKKPDAHRGDAKGAKDAMTDAPHCFEAGCATPATSCIEAGTGAGPSCVPGQTVNCCESDEVVGGTFVRGDADGGLATVSDFHLDRFEVTVGRFRKFVNAGLGTQASPPKAGVGANPRVPGSGWSSEWNSMLPGVTSDLLTDLICDNDPDNYNYTWTDTVQNNEVLPINCITWYEAFAFCAWDGGRLPTYAEWNYAAAGGSQQRVYPWSNPPTNTTISPAYAVYDCTGHGGPAEYDDAGDLLCGLTDIPPVGSKSPMGDGRWGQSDLAGSMYEWTLDWFTVQYPLPCKDCAVVDGGPADAGPDAEVGRVILSGGYYDDPDALYAYEEYYFGPYELVDNDGIRCARDP